MIKFDNNIDRVKEHSDAIPDAAAIITNSGKISYRELDLLVENAVNELIFKGIGSGSHCALISDNNPEFIIWVLALWRIGAVPIPLNIRLTNEELIDQINFADCEYIFVHKNSNTNFHFDDKRITVFPFNNINSNNAANMHKPQINDTALMLFTSGSSNKPKTVVITFSNLYASAIQTYKLVDAVDTDTWLASLPFYHIGGFMIFVRALLIGNGLIVPDSISNNSLSHCLTTFNPKFISLVSTQLERMINENISPNNDLKALFLGGGPIKEKLITKAKENNWPVIKVYGSTETCSMVAALDLRDEIYKVESAGKAIQNNSISILGKEKGEIIIECDSVAQCYYKEDSDKLLNNRFRSNDFGFIDDEGYLFIEGRLDDIIISGGENINSNEITNALLENNKILDAYTFGIDDEQWGQLVASAVAANSSDINEEMIKEYLKSKIASYKIPKKIFFVKSLPKTELGKVRKEELLKLLIL